jgi:hypothetical protein
MSAPLPEETFWMVCQLPTHPNARTEPKARYTTRGKAVTDAEHLARETGRRFVVLETVHVTTGRGELTPGLF